MTMKIFNSKLNESGVSLIQNNYLSIVVILLRRAKIACIFKVNATFADRFQYVL